MPEIAPVDKIEADFFRALERLHKGRPNHPDNKEAAEAGKLKITFSSLATEAGHSRTLISQEGRKCKYPRVRKEVMEIITKRRGVETVSGSDKKILSMMRNRELDVEINCLKARMQALVIEVEAERRRFKSDHDADQREIKLLREQLTALREQAGKVVSIVKGK
ncbi:MAG: hypothetical protein O9320_15990 [Magnetospirillum sp.]|nr:hypothetical protein [Magnetospirillum sp.]